MHPHRDLHPAGAGPRPRPGSPVLLDVLDLVARGGFAAATTAMLAMVAIQVRSFVPWTLPGLVLTVVPIAAWIAFAATTRTLCASLLRSRR